MKASEISADILAELKLSAFSKLHHGGCGNEFGDGRGAEQRLLRRDRSRVLVVDVAVPFSEENLSIFDEDEADGRDRRVSRIISDKIIYPLLDLMRISELGTFSVSNTRLDLRQVKLRRRHNYQENYWEA